jgi:predicted phage terminase large subunit-like protein
VPAGTPGALSRVFIPAKIDDNPVLMAADPGYATRLEGLDPISAARQRHGNWLIKPSPGLLFKRGWIKNWLDVVPEDITHLVRYWDLAATEAKKTNDPDWTVGILMGKTKTNRIVVVDAQRAREDPGTVEALVKSTGELDRSTFGRRVVVRWGLDPGQAGKVQTNAMVKLLMGMDADGIRETGDKIVRFGPFSAQCKAGNVDFVRGAWNAPVVQTLEAFPQKGVHDDDADGCSGAFNYLTPAKQAAEKLKGALAAFAK